MAVRESAIRKRLAKIEQELAAHRRQRSTDSLVPWAYCPRPVFLARFILNHHADDGDHAAKIRQALQALRSEVGRRQEFATDTDVRAALELTAEYSG